MILNIISSFDKQYKELQKSLVFNEDLTLSSTIIKLKEPIHKFLTEVTLDCYFKNDISFYEDTVLNNENNLNWFKDAHSKKEFINYLSSLND